MGVAVIMRGQRGVLLWFLFPSLVSIVLTGCGAGTASSKPGKPERVVNSPGPEDPDAPKEFTTTESGLKYRICRKSDGKKPTIDHVVTVNYRGWLDDGKLFDTTYGTGGAPALLEMRNFVPGWQEGLALVGEGGMIELEIPYKLGYGERGAPPDIPPKATLHFLVEVIKVTDAPKLPPDLAAAGVSPMGDLKPGKVDPDAPEEFTTTDSGLKYRIRRKSDGKKPTASNSVKVHYRGWLDNGKEFDSSYSRKKPEEFPLKGVIAGWTEGLQLIGVGGMIELEVPGPLGYKERGNPPTIPSNATLHFVVELLEVR
jgi:FKBP-type peptidyl-prolyl cis-trans isomerase